LIKIYEERNAKSLFMKYTIYNDRIRIQGFPGFYFFDIKFSNIEQVEIKRGLVIRDFSKPRFIHKNDLADLFEHVAIVKRSGLCKEVRITPKNPKRFADILIDAVRSYRGASD
jgi:hypothetical protein